MVCGPHQFNNVSIRNAHVLGYDNPDTNTNTGYGNRACVVTKIQGSNCGAGLKLKMSSHAHHEIAASYDHTNQAGKDKAAAALMGINLPKGMSLYSFS